jgi:broad specificity phosphatase PhoE
MAAVSSCPVEIVEDLREIDFGDFEGLPFDEIASRYPDRMGTCTCQTIVNFVSLRITAL